MIELLHGDCLERLKELPDCSVDACVTDPPYGLSFMGKAWDYDVPGAEVWREVLRVLKPGGHLLAFAGTRTQHRMAVQIEDAGFEIRDMIAWVYGSGFPKSLDVSKAIDKAGGNPLAWRAFSEAYATAVQASAFKHSDIDRALGIKSSSCYWARTDHRGGMPPRHHWEAVRELLGLSADFERLYDEAEREVVGQRTTGIGTGKGSTPIMGDGSRDITAPATPAAQQWAGWGTALKPALEPITVARKPLTGTVAANVLEHGTGAINVDGCRVAGVKGVPASPSNAGSLGWSTGGDMDRKQQQNGRWPANLIHDGSDEVVGLFPQTASGGGFKQGMVQQPRTSNVAKGAEAERVRNAFERDSGGSAARFFYCAKASKADRGDGNGHPTVKPTELMRYLCRLVTPPGGVVLDPFMGSGSTGKAAVLEGFRFIGIEREEEYLATARGRIQLLEHGTLR
jgi:DNA modification methylase